MKPLGLMAEYNHFVINPEDVSGKFSRK